MNTLYNMLKECDGTNTDQVTFTPAGKYAVSSKNVTYMRERLHNRPIPLITVSLPSTLPTSSSVTLAEGPI